LPASARAWTAATARGTAAHRADAADEGGQGAQRSERRLEIRSGHGGFGQEHRVAVLAEAVGERRQRGGVAVVQEQHAGAAPFRGARAPDAGAIRQLRPGPVHRYRKNTY
jgi:hypothetical protein